MYTYTAVILIYNSIPSLIFKIFIYEFKFYKFFYAKTFIYFIVNHDVIYYKEIDSKNLLKKTFIYEKLLNVIQT